ncbi:MAG: hypothetical protein KL863_25500 [Rhizobium sp.]|jgi:hypothetical protein|nr:hypothetical protein [Rhizobium sp.]
MQTYFYDIHWDRETLVDDEGTSHFDDGSAIYYARVVASRIARCGKGERVRVHVRDARGRLLSIQCPGPLSALSERQAQIRSIVERDAARQETAAG